jgi:hypothetical protein
MKKLILSAAIGVGISISAFATSFSVTVLPGTMTNILSFSPNQGPVLVKQFVLTSVGVTGSSVQIVDCPSSSLSYVQAAYTNRVSYATNYVQVWTNFYGVVQSNNYVGGQLLTNYWLVDITNNLVPASINFYSVRAQLASAGNATVIFGPPNGQGNVNGYYFDNGIWATNTSTGTNLITIMY